MLDQLPKLKEVLDPHLERVLKELQSEGPAGGEASTSCAETPASQARTARTGIGLRWE